MDIKELKKECLVFAQKSAEKGYAFDHFCLVEAFEGVSNTAYTMHIRADWITTMDCVQALDMLADIIFESMSLKARQKIFTINIFDSEGQLHCPGYPLIENGEKVKHSQLK